MSSEDYSKGELIACVIARELSNEDTIAIGLHAELMMAAAMLSQKIYSPGLKIRHGLSAERGIELNPAAWTLNTDTKTDKIVEYQEEHDSILTLANPGNPNLMCDTFFVGGLQIDKHGNTNLIGIKNGAAGGFKLRGPGSIGTTSVAQVCKKYYLFSLEHTKRVFVEKVDYISTIGYAIRKEKGMEGGPKLCITPLCVFDFKDGAMRLKSIHPGHTLGEIKENTGFEFLVGDVKETEKPTQKEIEALQEIDVNGVLKDVVK
ncbi:hypothetical protein KY360_00380 [Candidatus Woesearchaeota archaeon]|nr:hypothetical protein [Candidatus Woesearchaeota archaeon]